MTTGFAWDAIGTAVAMIGVLGVILQAATLWAFPGWPAGEAGRQRSRGCVVGRNPSRILSRIDRIHR